MHCGVSIRLNNATYLNHAKHENGLPLIEVPWDNFCIFASKGHLIFRLGENYLFIMTQKKCYYKYCVYMEK